MISKNSDFWIVRSAVCSVSSYGWLRVFRDIGFKIYGVDIEDYCRRLNLLNKFKTVMKAKPENEKELLYQFEHIIREVRPVWIISAPENEIYILSKNEEFFKLRGVDLFHSPLETVEIIKDKFKLYNTISQKVKNFMLPKTFLISELLERGSKELLNFDKIIIKPIEGRGSANIVTYDIKKGNIFDIERFKNFLISKEILSQEFIVQEFIDGTELSVDVLFSNNGEILNIIPRTRDIVDSGIATVTTTFWDESLVNIIREISSFLFFRYINNFQFIKRDKNYYLIDINPRFGGASIISWYSKESFQKNLIYLLLKDYDKVKADISEPKNLKMIRYYTEFYYDPISGVDIYE